MKALRIILVAVLTSSMVFLTGCWNYREVENLYIVAGFAIDSGMQGHKYHLTFEVLDLSGGSDGQSTMKGKLIESEGDTIADAVKNVSKISSKSLYFSDARIVIFSREIAAAGMTQVMDWLNRDPQPRFTMYMLVSQEKTASEILKGGQAKQEVMSNNISQALELTASVNKAPTERLYEADDKLWGEGKDLTMPTVRINTMKVGSQIEIDGTAVFRDDKYVGLLDDRQTNYFSFITRNIGGGVFLIGEKPEDETISMQIQKNDTKIEPEINGNSLKMKINAKMQMVFDEENAYTNYVDSWGLDRTEKFVQNSLEQRLTETVQFVQKEFDCDIFGFGRKVYEKYPELWTKIKPKWREYFKNLKFEVKAEAQINNTGFAFPKGRK